MTNEPDTLRDQIPEPINSIGLLCAVAEHAGRRDRTPRISENLAEKLSSRHGLVNTDTLTQLWLELRQELRGQGEPEKLRALADQAHQDIYLQGWPVPTGHLSMQDRARLRVAIARHKQALRKE